MCVPVSHWAGIQMSQAPFALELVISAPALACISHIQTHTQKPLPWRGQTEAGEESNYASRCQLCSHGLKERKDFASDEVHVKGEGRLKLSLPYPARGQVHAPGARRTALTDVGGGGQWHSTHLGPLSPEWAYSIFRQHLCPRSKLDCLPHAFYHVYN